MASLGATSKGSAESTGTDALDVYDMSGGIALDAMKNTCEKLDDRTRSYFTGSEFVEFQQTKDGGETLTPKRRPDGADMRQFLLELLMFPLHVSHKVMEAWEKERDLLLTDDEKDLLASRRTGSLTGEVLRETDLSESPPLLLHDIRNDAGEQKAIVQGFVTEYMVDIQRARGPDSQGRARSRRYVQFTSTNRGLISGLEVSPSEASRILHVFGRWVKRDITPETAWEDLRTGDKVPIHGPGGAKWLLHLRHNGRIEIRGARISQHRDHLMAPGLQGLVGFEQLGSYLFLRGPEALETFFQHFPPDTDARHDEPDALAA